MALLFSSLLRPKILVSFDFFLTHTQHTSKSYWLYPQNILYEESNHFSPLLFYLGPNYSHLDYCNNLIIDIPAFSRHSSNHINQIMSILSSESSNDFLPNSEWKPMFLTMAYKATYDLTNLLLLFWSHILPASPFLMILQLHWSSTSNMSSMLHLRNFLLTAPSLWNVFPQIPVWLMQMLKWLLNKEVFLQHHIQYKSLWVLPIFSALDLSPNVITFCHYTYLLFYSFSICLLLTRM